MFWPDLFFLAQWTDRIPVADYSSVLQLPTHTASPDFFPCWHKTDHDKGLLS